MDIRRIVLPFIKGAKPGDDRISGLCPFHEETHPSFSMSLEPGKEGLYFCFACHASGNLATFLKRMRVSPETIDRLTKDLSQQLVGRSERRYKGSDTGESSFLPESILAAFHECPTSLLDAGFAMSVLETYDIGFDRQRHRITFPLRNDWGQLIGISGRAMGDWEPRYLVYTEREFANFPEYKRPKKNYLWNLDRVYAERVNGSQDRLYIVEGFKVCMWLVQRGYRHTVALASNMMTRDQRKLIERIPGEIVLALDNDEAGQAGTADIGRKLSTLPGCRILVVDPHLLDQLDTRQLDELDTDALQNVLARPIPFTTFLSRRNRKEPSYGIRT